MLGREYVRFGVFWKVLEAGVQRLSSDELRFGRRRWFRPPNVPLDAWFGRLTLPPKVELWLESRLSAAEGNVRPPKVPDFRLWREGSAAEGAAEPTRVSSLEETFGRRRCRRKCLSSLFMAVFYACFSDV
ncbi:hypothetical protein MANES_04G040234v8 [Manihot esculenta]|uniref:Uncharacterized protein n=1 Tax=Manihot esculenta TaxID=3983 RepID=A0ACB7HTP6_MANES|nr:hypothetical protein MANES_04G040234v8 [Manihot esculenta]